MDIIDQDVRAKEIMLKRYKKHVTTGRVLMYIFLGMAFVGNFISLIRQPEFKSMLLIQLSVIIVFLGINILSHKKPFIALLILSIMCFFGTAAYTITSVAVLRFGVEGKNITVMIAGIAVQVLVNVLMIRSVIGAWKYEQLKKEMKNT